MDRAFHTLQEVDAHESLDAGLTAFPEVLRLLLCQILRQLAWQDELCWCVDRKSQIRQAFIYFLVVERSFFVGQLWIQGYRLVSLGEGADFFRVVISLNVVARS